MVLESEPPSSNPAVDSTAPTAPTLAEGVASDEVVEQYERTRPAVEERLRREFRRNLEQPLRITRLQLTSVNFFADTVWDLQPSVNLVLGRNGYGKSLLLRTLAGMLQRHEAATEALVRDAPSGRIVVELARGADTERVERMGKRFTEPTGKVPLLAIPDSRFTDRSTLAVKIPEPLNLATEGADHLLKLEPFQTAIDTLLFELCLDYLDHGRSFELPSFKLLTEVINRLTDRTFRFHRIDRDWATGFSIEVVTEGMDQPISIQQASQGTLSVLVIFGLIRRFLQDIARTADRSPDSDDVLKQQAIVLIDEVDAHLHPLWQQQVYNLLTEFFPNVQFLLSAHSPLVVAGCGPGEAVVLRPSSDGFALESLDRDFVGAEAEEIYRDVFDVEEPDPVYLAYATAKTRRRDDVLARDIDRLEKRAERKGLKHHEELELDRLYREFNRIRRVARVQKERLDKEHLIVQRDAEIRRLRAKLKEREG